MNSTNLNARFLFITAVVFIAASSRIFPHIPNFTPIAAMALFGGACMSNKRMAFIIPFVAMLISDFIIGFHNTMIYVYVAFAITGFIGWGLRDRVKPGSLFIASLASSVIFFLITNFGVWAAEGMPNGTSGMLSAYVLGVPFFRMTLLGDLFYNTILFGSFYLAQLRFPVLAKVQPLKK
ncbi:MAG: hypothetical protein HYU69_08470 [Bacteroidetes bacterium]|nr:hypothetical protein [Bacteroidota bacterium]